MSYGKSTYNRDVSNLMAAAGKRVVFFTTRQGDLGLTHIVSDETDEHGLRRVVQGPGVRKCEQADHRYQPGSFGVCERCGGERP